MPIISDSSIRGARAPNRAGGGDDRRRLRPDGPSESGPCVIFGLGAEFGNADARQKPARTGPRYLASAQGLSFALSVGRADGLRGKKPREFGGLFRGLREIGEKAPARGWGSSLWVCQKSREMRRRPSQSSALL